MTKKNILCIDDVKSNLFILHSIIDDAASDSYNILTAQSAHTGLEILLKNSIDIILLDVMMPNISGFETAKIIKSNKRTKDIPIIFITACKADKTIETCYDVGGADYINKPFNSVELLARISFHLQLREKDKIIQKLMEDIKNV